MRSMQRGLIFEVVLEVREGCRNTVTSTLFGETIKKKKKSNNQYPPAELMLYP